MTRGIGRHCQKRSRSIALASATKMLRSIAAGTIRVHHALNAGRAMIVCCTTKSMSSAELISSATVIEPGTPESMFFGTAMSLTKPIAYTIATRNIA